jgi:hypothetical protein
LFRATGRSEGDPEPIPPQFFDIAVALGLCPSRGRQRRALE